MNENTLFTLFQEVSDGLPGALECLVSLKQNFPAEFESMLLWLKEWGICGELFWDLYTDTHASDVMDLGCKIQVVQLIAEKSQLNAAHEADRDKVKQCLLVVPRSESDMDRECAEFLADFILGSDYQAHE